MKTRNRIAPLALTAVLALGVAACGDSADTTDTTDSSTEMDDGGMTESEMDGGMTESEPAMTESDG